MRRTASLLFLCSMLAAATVNAGETFKISSTDVQDNQSLKPPQVFKGFGCDGGNRSPQMQWSGAPAGTKSFAVTMYDPDAPTGSGWWHWIVYNLPASVNGLGADAGQPGKLPLEAKHGRNDYGRFDFGGACPPPGDKPHRYILTVHALRVEQLDVPNDASAALIGYMLNANRLGSATLTATYGR
ncbi:MAG TPA: YbhB/YbcL family Raf kinase inhibitor-like protein [Paucimonas sp.]|nr:YbhB/YbcL family Raf kinase inhibitor-like protein [Paucimonas sp.]